MAQLPLDLQESPFGRPLGLPPGLSPINLADEGLQQGDVLDPYLDDFVGDGVDVQVPAGEYALNDLNSLFPSFNGVGAIRGVGGVVYLDSEADSVRANIDGKLYIAHFQLSDGTDDRVQFTADGGSEIELNNVRIPHANQGRFDCKGFRLSSGHAGLGIFRNCYVSDANDGIYASSFGRPGEGGGFIWVIGGLYESNSTNSVRIAGDGSTVHGVTFVNTRSDMADPSGNMNGLRVREDGDMMLARDCHFLWDDVGGQANPIVIHPDVIGCDGSLHLENVVIENHSDNDAIVNGCGMELTGNNIHLTGSGDLSTDGDLSNVCEGSGCQVPRDRGVYFTTGTPDDDPNVYAADFFGGTTEPPEPECEVDADCPDGFECVDGFCVPIPLDELYDHHLVVETFTGDPVTLYEFVVDGEVEPESHTATESATELIDNGDGTFTCRGQSGNGFVDEWFYTGDVLTFEATDRDSGAVVSDPDRFALILDGSQISSEELTGGDEPPADPSDIDVTDIRLSHQPVVGESVTITVDAMNTGGQTGQATFSVDVSGSPVGSVSFNIAPDSLASDTVSWVPSASGPATITAGGVALDTTVQTGDDPPDDPDDTLEVTFGTVAVIGGVTILAYRYLRDRDGGGS